MPYEEATTVIFSDGATNEASIKPPVPISDATWTPVGLRSRSISPALHVRPLIVSRGSVRDAMIQAERAGPAATAAARRQGIFDHVGQHGYELRVVVGHGHSMNFPA